MNTKSAINRFDSGIDMDTSLNKYKNSNYYDAQDMRIISKDALNIGALSNVIGNDSAIDIDDGIQKVIASTTINDDLFLFTYGIVSSEIDIYYQQLENSFLAISFGEFSYNWQVVDSPTTVPPGYIGNIYYNLDSGDIQNFFEAFKNSTELTSHFIITYDGGASSPIIFTPKDTNTNYKATTSIHNYIDTTYTNTGSSIYKAADYKNSDISTQSILLYRDSSSINKLNFDTADHVSVLGKFETNSVSKLYWANGIDPLRSMNLSVDYTGEDANVFDYIPNVSFGSILTTVEMGGSLPSGSVQYAYQYFNVNGSSTTFSPASDIVRISKFSESSIGGSDIGINTGKSVFITINDLDHTYSNIRIVSLFYEQFDSNPVVNIVAESSFSSYDSSISVTDSGVNIESMTLDEFRAFAQTTVIPKYIETKDNILFAANLTEDTFVSDEIDNWDSRAYAFSGYFGTSRIYNTPTGGATIGDYYILQQDGSFTINSDGVQTGTGVDWNIPESFECCNRDNSLFYNDCSRPTYSFYPNSTGSGDEVEDDNNRVFGGKGKNLHYKFNWYQQPSVRLVSKNNDEFYLLSDSNVSIPLIECQPDEIYRVGIKFFNNKGQSSFTKWIADIRWPYMSHYISSFQLRTPALEVSVNSFPNDSSIVGYQIVRASRNESGRSIMSTGVITPAASTVASGLRPYIESPDDTVPKPMVTASILAGIDAPTSGSTLDKNIVEFISQESLYNNPLNDQYEGKKLCLAAIFTASTSVVAVGSSVDSNLSELSCESLHESSQFDVSLSTMSYDIGVSQKVTTSHQYEGTPTPKYSRISDYRNQFVVTNSGQLARGSRCSGVVLGLDSDLSISYSATVGTDEKYLTAYIVDNLDLTRYGGYSVQNRSNSEYIKFSEYVDISTSTATCTNGDIYRRESQILRGLFYRFDNTVNSVQQLLKLILPSSIDYLYASNGFDYYSSVNDSDGPDFPYLQETVVEGITLYPQLYNENIGDLYVYNNVYSKEPYAQIGFSKPLYFNQTEFNPNKIISSQNKINGEINDSWTNFLAANFIEVEGGFGEITELIRFKNKLMFFQKNAFGTLSVNDRSLIEDNNVGSISLGTGGVLTRYDYISQYSGIKLPTDIISTNKSIYYIDSDDKGIYSINDPDNSISEMNGVNSFLYDNINSSNERLCGFDIENGEVLFTIGNTTLCYNENLKNFTSRYSCVPTKYITTPNGLYSQLVDTTRDLSFGYVYRHNQGNRGLWYKEVNDGVYSVSKVSVIVNPNGNIENSFDNIELRTEVYSGDKNAPLYKDIVEETVSRIKFSNSYIHEISTEAAPEGLETARLKRLARKWRAQVPQTANGNRFIDSYLLLTLEFDNNNNKLFKLHDIITKFRQYNN